MRRERPDGSRGHGPRSGAVARRARRLAVLAAGLAVVLATGPLGAQEEELDVPAMAESPRQFHLGASVAVLSWSNPASPATTDPDVDGGALVGLDVERLLTRFASIRLSGAYGSTTVSAPAGSVDVNTALFELSLHGRLALSSLREVGVVPYAGLGIGSVVFDPVAEDLTTNSQNSLSYGGGLEVRALPRIGFRAEWKHHAVELENLFDPTDRTGRDRNADRFQASVYWTF